MPLINEIISTSSYELIRERIAEILYTELQNQYDYTADEDVNIPRVFIERMVAFNVSEMPVINVQVAQVDLDNHSQLGADGTGIYWIDFHCKAQATDDNDGGYIAQTKMQKLLGICRHILEHSNYKTLAFAPPFIMNKHVTGIRFNTAETKDAHSVASGRILFSVRAPERIGVFTPLNIAQWTTVIKLHESEAGYKWIGQPGEGFDLTLDTSF
jgi:hypothetical protein